MADSNAPVLLTGENGTGKSLLARLVHGWSGRRERSLIEVNIGALPDGVSKVRCSVTSRARLPTRARSARAASELADGGTLFLDEVRNLPGRPAGKAVARAGERAVQSRLAPRVRGAWTCA